MLELNYATLISLIDMFSSVYDLLELITDEESNSEQKYEAKILLDSIHIFNFVFNLL